MKTVGHSRRTPSRPDRERGADAELQRLIRSWLARYDSNQTRGAYRNDLSRWMQWCQEHRVPLMEASGHHITLYRQSEPCGSLATGDAASTSTVSRRLASLSSFYRHCVAAGALEQNPLEQLRRNRSVSRAAITGLDAEETRRLLGAAKSSSPRDFVIISLQLVDGFRAGELLGLRRSDVDLDRDVPAISVAREDGRIDDVAIAPATAEGLRSLLEYDHDGWLFHTHAGLAVRRQYVYQVVRRMARRAGIVTPVSCQSLHQTFLSACDAGALTSLGGGAVAIDVRRSDGLGAGNGNQAPVRARVHQHAVLELRSANRHSEMPKASAS